MINKLWCWLRGHDMIVEYFNDNGRSHLKHSHCLRCGLNHDSQYDYDV